MKHLNYIKFWSSFIGNLKLEIGPVPRGVNLKFQAGGFTLIELLLYMLLFPMLMLIISSLFGSVMDTQLESQSYSSVDLDGRYVLAKLAYDFQSADSSNDIDNNIMLPATASAGTELDLKINNKLHTYNASSSGSLHTTLPQLLDLTSSESSVSALTFERIGPGGNRDTIKVKFRLTSKINRHQGAEYRDFQSTFAFP